ncbi:manganese-binding transcriptional regulator MntR [Acidisoma cladoniae]|uniref:manganese-binding transcriptional regulator MntR n=1 Tax=Acidisoma cladoniae TaxID=3040935 RepID=UPI0033132AB0
MTELPTQPTQARRFSKTRDAHNSALLQDYAELIDDLITTTGSARASEIARRLGVSHVTVIKAVTRMEREGLAVTKPYRGIALTEQGQALADRVRARHRLVVNLLVSLDIPLEIAEQDAEGIEHYVSDTTLQAFAHFLARKTD